MSDNWDIGTLTRYSVENSVWGSVWDSVSNSVWCSVRDSVFDSVSGPVRDSVGDSVRRDLDEG